MSAIDQKEDWLLARQSGIGGTKVERELEGGMTSEEAWTEALNRWGATAYATNDYGYFEVGSLRLSVMGNVKFNPSGIGDSWEAAFADADRKENGR